MMINLNCTKKEVKNINNVSVKNYSKLDVCGCNEQGNFILDASITIMKPLKNIKTLKKNNIERVKMKTLLDKWSELMTACFKKHGPNMWTPSDCNDLKLIVEKKDTLYNFGVQIDRGDLLKL